MAHRQSPWLLMAVAALLESSSPAWAAPHSYTVVLDKMSYGRLPGTVRRGDTIVWVNRDMFRHTASATDHSFDVDLPPGAKARTVLKRTGRISFICRFHPGMRGVLIVK